MAALTSADAIDYTREGVVYARYRVVAANTRNAVYDNLFRSTRADTAGVANANMAHAVNASRKQRVDGRRQSYVTRQPRSQRVHGRDINKERRHAAARDVI